MFSNWIRFNVFFQNESETIALKKTSVIKQYITTNKSFRLFNFFRIHTFLDFTCNKQIILVHFRVVFRIKKNWNKTKLIRITNYHPSIFIKYKNSTIFKKTVFGSIASDIVGPRGIFSFPSQKILTNEMNFSGNRK